MGRRSEDKHCINCNAILPARYKGRQRIYCGHNCRKAYALRKKDNT